MVQRGAGGAEHTWPVARARRAAPARAQRPLVPRHAFVQRDTNNGAVTVWFDGVLVADARGVATWRRGNKRLLTISIAKI